MFLFKKHQVFFFFQTGWRWSGPLRVWGWYLWHCPWWLYQCTCMCPWDCTTDSWWPVCVCPLWYQVSVHHLYSYSTSTSLLITSFFVILIIIITVLSTVMRFINTDKVTKISNYWFFYLRCLNFLFVQSIRWMCISFKNLLQKIRKVHIYSIFEKWQAYPTSTLKWM